MIKIYFAEKNNYKKGGNGVSNENQSNTNRLYRSIGFDNFNKIFRFFGMNLLGSYIFAMGVQIFTKPFQIAPGGIAGLATILNYAYPQFPIGITVSVINAPLLVLAWLYVSREFAVRTAVSTVIFSFCVDVLVVWMPQYPSVSSIAPLMASLFGGILMGVGNALVYMVHSTTGGTAIIGALIQTRYPHLSMGKLLTASNSIVVVVSMIVFNNIDTAIFACVCIYISGLVMDNMVYGLNTNRLLFIISEKSPAIQLRILHELHRGVTILEGEGGYNHAKKSIIFCVVSKAQFYKVRRITMEMDSNAFIVGCEAGDVLGKGFKHLD